MVAREPSEPHLVGVVCDPAGLHFRERGSVAVDFRVVALFLYQKCGFMPPVGPKRNLGCEPENSGDFDL